MEWLSSCWFSTGVGFLLFAMYLKTVNACEVWQEKHVANFPGNDTILKQCIYEETLVSGFPQDIKNDTEYLSLEGTQMEDYHWNGLAVKEQVDGLLAINLFNNSLTLVPDVKHFADTLQMLLLDRNNIVSLDLNSFNQFSVLDRLSLKHNKLTNIDIVEHDKEVTIRYLYLSNNLLPLIDLSLFQRCHISILFFGKNPATTIITPLDQSTIDIKHLDVGYISLSEFPNVTFNDNLQKLSLVQNNIKTINMNFLSNLRYVSIKQNSIETFIESDIQFSKLLTFSLVSCNLEGEFNLTYFKRDIFPNLKIISLSKNTINNLIPPPDIVLPSVTDFEIHNNGFSQLDMDFYSTHMPKIERLDISSNLITVVHTLSNISSLPHLEELDLNHNPLLSIPDFCQINIMKPPLLVNVSGVPITCDGCVAWMQTCPGVTFIEPTCTQPQRLAGVNVMNILEYNFFQGICPATITNTHRRYVFTKRGSVDMGITNTTIDVSPWTGELDCGRRCIAVGGLSFIHRFDDCVIYQKLDGEFQVTLSVD